MKKVLSMVLASALLFCFVGCGNAKKEDLQTIRVSEVTRSVFYAPQYVALSQGFFKEEGLDIALTTGQGADKVMTAVVSNQVEIGFSGPEAAVYVYNEGKENYAVVFAQVTKRDGSFILGRNKDEQFKWENLRGKKILGGRKGGVPEMTLEYVIGKNGLKPNVDVNVDTSVQFALMAGAFTGGEGDYVTLFEPTASMVEMEGKGYILASVGEESGEIPYTCYYATKDYIKNNPQVIEKFTRALAKGQKWVQEHTSEEIAKAIAEYFPDTSVELLTKVTQRHKDIDAFMDTPVLKEEAFDRLQDVMMQAGVITQKADFSKVVDNTFALKTQENK